MVAISTATTTLLTAAALPAALGMSLRRLDAMEYQAVMSRPPANCIIQNGFDFVGNDISNAPGALDSCCNQCSNTNGCQAWSWTNQNGGTCYFKSKGDQVVVNANVKSAWLAYGNVPTCQLQQDVDFVDNDLSNVPSNNAGSCCSLCQSTLGCRAYVWTNYNGGTCWLKSSAGQRVYKAGAQAAEAYGASTYGCNNLISGVDYPGNDIGNKPSATASGCCDICKGFSGCNAFSWTSQSGGTCYLKSATGAAVNKDGVWSSQVYPNPQCNVETGLDYVGNDIANVANGDYSACCGICRSTSGCKAWSWSNYNGGTCWLKSGKGATANNSGVNSGTI